MEESQGWLTACALMTECSGMFCQPSLYLGGGIRPRSCRSLALFRYAGAWLRWGGQRSAPSRPEGETGIAAINTGVINEAGREV